MSSVVLRSIASTQSQDMSALGADPMAHLDHDMRHVLDTLLSLDPKPISDCTPEEARAQPTLMTAMRRLLRDRPDEGGVTMEMRLIPGPAGDIRIRVYAPTARSADEVLPLILYLHGGGFVIGDLERDDETPRALVRKCHAVVVSAHYRQGPEARFPAAHDDAAAAFRWVIDNAASIGADPMKMAIVGEDAGGNLALNLALAARTNSAVRIRHLALIAPMVDADFSRQSFADAASAKPVEADAIAWFYRNAIPALESLDDPRLALLEQDLSGLPPTTIILAGVDPLRSEGEALAAALQMRAVWTDMTVYDGVTAQFFGLARIVNKAMFAQGQVARNLKESFA